VGNDEIAVALAKIGKILKYQVTIIDPLLTKSQIPEADRIVKELDLTGANLSADSSIVVASRGKYDEEALLQAVRTPAAYIALVGSKKRGAELIERMRSSGVPEDSLKRIRCPAGLEIHASTPEEIALSILAEIVHGF
jgi:xanthine dehydrogenase accessory factor